MKKFIKITLVLIYISMMLMAVVLEDYQQKIYYMMWVLLFFQFIKYDNEITR